MGSMKGKLALTASIIILSAVAGIAFDAPGNVNTVIDHVNAAKNRVSLFSKGPDIAHVPVVPFRLGLDLQGGVHLEYKADLSSVSPSEYNSSMAGLRDVIERRVNLFGAKEPVVQVEGSGGDQRLLVEIAGVIDPAEAVRLIGQTPYLEFREPKTDYISIVQENQRIVEAGGIDLRDPFEPTTLSGRYLSRAELGFSTVASQPIIQLQFDSEGSKMFEDMTARNVGKPIAIFLDGSLIQNPTVESVIVGGKAQITGSFTLDEAKQVVRDLNAGALPIPIDLIAQKQVGPTLGQESLAKSLQAASFGFLLVVGFMLLFYRLPGLVASVALAMYIIFVLAIFKVAALTITLAGIGGLILSVGMAVDANILVFARMREELKAGRTLAQAIDEGFRRAWPSIRDGNITTLLVALILFWVGSSFVQGFALSLSIGILMSMVSALVITKTFMKILSFVPVLKIKVLWK